MLSLLKILFPSVIPVPASNPTQLLLAGPWRDRKIGEVRGRHELPLPGIEKGIETQSSQKDGNKKAREFDRWANSALFQP